MAKNTLNDAFDNLVARLNGAGKNVVVGVVGPAAQRKHPEYPGTVGELAHLHVYGDGARIPARDFIGQAMEARDANVQRVVQAAVKAAAEGRKTEDQALALLGQYLAGQIQEFMVAEQTKPELAPSTIARKGSSVPLVDGGTLRQSITFEVRNK